MQQLFGHGGVSINKIFRSISSNQDVKLTVGSRWDFDESIYSDILNLKVMARRTSSSCWNLSVYDSRLLCRPDNAHSDRCLEVIVVCVCVERYRRPHQDNSNSFPSLMQYIFEILLSLF